MQVVDPAAPVKLSVRDLSEWDVAARETEADLLIQEEAARRFDLATGWGLRVGLLRLSGEEHILLMTLHHIVFDGWSLGVLFEEFEQSLRGLCSRAVLRLSTEPQFQYGDYSVWQRAWLQGEMLERQLGYWRERLAGAEPLSLPTDHSRPAVASFRGAMHSFALSAELASGLRALAREERATLFMVLLAGFQAVLSRWSGQQDVVVGTQIAGRTHRETERLVGFFVNTLPLRVQVMPHARFRELLEQVREAALGAYGHQDLPFEKLVAELAPERDLSRQPIVQVLFSLQNMSLREPQLGSVTFTSMGLDHRTSRFDLSLYMREQGDVIHAGLEYATDLFEAQTIERLARHLERVLEQAVANPQQRVRDFDLLDAAERARLLAEWNPKVRVYPQDRCLHELFSELVLPASARVCVVDESLELVPQGAVGELCIAGAGLLRGHSGSAGLTAERFVANPYGEAGERMYRTGDLVRWRQDRKLEVLGRVDEPVKLRGRRIELGMIETALLTHPGVEQAAVLIRDDVAGEKRLVAYVSGARAAPDSGELRTHLKRSLPDYMIPQVFMLLESLPRMADGRLDRKALPTPERPAEVAYVAARTPVEAALAQVWAEVLDLDRVGVHDNFFDLGGDSVRSVQLVARARGSGLRVSVRQIFAHQTVEGLARVCAAAVDSLHIDERQETGNIHGNTSEAG